MKQNELRVNIWVYDTEDKQNIQITDSNAWRIAEEYDYFEPIPLTEEWLVGFGFKMYDRMGDNLFFLHPLYERIKLEVCIWSDKSIDVNIFDSKSSKFEKCQELKYVHQLQNFVFALTFNELECK